jgi:6-phosphogluconolactonase (cycloisomerase 2 family)
MVVEISIRIRQAAVALCAVVLLGACTGGVHSSGSSGGTSGSTQYTVGGTVSGLNGSGLVLASNTGETLPVTGNGSFTFKTTFPAGSPYYALVLTQPSTPTQTCVATNGAGTVGNSNVTAITVTCQNKTVPTDAIGGMVIGLTGSGLVLQDNGTDTLKVAADGSFTFPTALPGGSTYDVSVLTPPINPYEDCVVLNGKGVTGDSDIANIAIACTVNSSATHTIGGTVTGVSGTLVLEDNGRDDLTITADGPFRFPLPVPSGSSYSVTTRSAMGAQSQACTFTNANGTVGDSDINNVTIVCTPNAALSAAVSGLAGTGLVLQNTDNGDTLSVAANGTTPFDAGLTNGGAYNVTVAVQPTNPSQTCVITNGTGTASLAAGATVTVTCTTNTYTVAGVVTGLPDPSSGANLNLVLQNNLGDNITIAPSANSPVAFTFATPIPSGSPYSVTVLSQPGAATLTNSSGVVTQTSTVCVVTGAGAGTVTSANIANVVVSCVRPLGFAYVTNSGDNSISEYVIDGGTGALLPLGQPVSAGTGPSSAVTASAGGTTTSAAYLYVTNSASNDLSGYAIDPNLGGLTPLAGSPYSAGLGLSTPTSIAVFPAGPGGLYITNAGNGIAAGSIAAFTVDTTGTVFTNLNGSPFAAQVGPQAGTFFYGGAGSSLNWYFLEADSGSNTVSAYAVDIELGGLTAVPNSPFTAGTRPTSIAPIQSVDPTLGTVDSVYVANSGDGTISAYPMSTQTGSLSPATQTINVGSGLNALAIASCGCYLFATSAQGVTVFSASTTGTLTMVGNGPYAAGAGPGPLATLSSFVYVVNTVDQTVSAFAQDATGALIAVGSPVKTGRTPSSIVVHFRPEG